MLCRVHGLKDSGEIKEALYSLLFLEKYVFWGTIRKKVFDFNCFKGFKLQACLWKFG